MLRMHLYAWYAVLQVSHGTRRLLLSHTTHVSITPSSQSRARVLAQLLELPPGLL
jgi:hypothetical protein